MNDTERKTLIELYIQAYNTFDVTGMLAVLDAEVVFINVSAGQVTLRLEGIDQFRTQARAAAAFFSERSQTITAMRHENEYTEIDIDYCAVVAEDLPNGLTKGQVLKLQGRSVFTFSETKILTIDDFS
ncbi:nuclear transport factor 2 family protein [Pedobacter sp. SYP-B3415]|uniref:nuclear transport factor 2 family protein n=1 Tax=Pedobacter sp. SYP-B3415 TaxID=2496641 RepID=UPI00101B73D3|nr:nuclear transport factor 2 family protein [Pedobacter sp. SYP-B3415]